MRGCGWPSSGAVQALSSPAVAQRLQPLERDGVIVSYPAEGSDTPAS